MSVMETLKPKRTGALVNAAVGRSRLLSKEGLRERAFSLAFSNLVYPQIWEDPVVDLDALQLGPESRVIAIASGGCNVLNYLTAQPAHITAVDINAAHIALMKLKLAAAQRLPNYESFFRFFGGADSPANLTAFKRHILPHLDEKTARYWQSRCGLRRTRRIRSFTRNFYQSGLLGSFIGASHFLARLHGRDPRKLLTARTLEDQRRIYERELAPLFKRRSVRWLVNRPASLFGLGIPPAQYRSLVGTSECMAEVLHQRLERLACQFPLSDNYFAWQAFARRYPPEGKGPLPPYLERANFGVVSTHAQRVSVYHRSLTAHLATLPAASMDRYVLLDAQDWMNNDTLTALWREITRTARPDSRVIFRTAAEPTLLPGRVPDTILSRWTSAGEASYTLTQKDRSAIYGGFHLYVLCA